MTRRPPSRGFEKAYRALRRDARAAGPRRLAAFDAYFHDGPAPAAGGVAALAGPQPPSIPWWERRSPAFEAPGGEGRRPGARNLEREEEAAIYGESGLFIRRGRPHLDRFPPLPTKASLRARARREAEEDA